MNQIYLMLSLCSGFMTAVAAKRFGKIGESTPHDYRNDTIANRSSNLTCGMGLVHGYFSGTGIRIIGGRDAKPGEFPFVVFLVSDWKANSGIKYSTSCGGSIIDEWHILTAAHCMNQCDLELIRTVAYLGKHEYDPWSGKRKLIDMSETHKDYKCDSKYAKNDIALLKVRERIKFELKPDGLGSVGSVCLPHSCDMLVGGRRVMVPGWGRIKHAAAHPKVLQVADLQIQNFNKCSSEFYRGKLDPVAQFCLISNSLKTNDCHGDSGGPVVRVINGLYQIIGIVSFGSGHCATSQPSVYTRVQAYLRWIERAKAGMNGSSSYMR